MPDARPKIVVFPGDGADPQRLQSRLESSFDVSVRHATSPADGSPQGTVPPGGDRPAAANGGAGLTGPAAQPATPPVPGTPSGAGGPWATALLNAIGEGVCLSRLSGEVLWSNELFNALDDGTRRLANAAAQETAQEILDYRRLGLPEKPGTRGSSQRLELASADGSRYFEMYVSVVEAAFEGKAPETLISAVLRDVTSANRVRLRMDAIDRAGAELFAMDADAVRKLNAAAPESSRRQNRSILPRPAPLRPLRHPPA